MKTKIALIIAYCCCSTFALYAQTSDAETEALINLLGVQKKEAIAKLVSLSADSAKFWKIYDEYQRENKENAKSIIKLYEKTARAYNNMTPALADSLAAQYFKNRVDQEKMLEAYYKKIKAATNSVDAFEFYQAEIYLITQIRANIMQQIPTYGELMKAKNK